MIKFGNIKHTFKNPYLQLFLLTLFYYSLYLSNVFLHLNTLLSSSVDDSLKNYFTYVFQIKNSPSLLHFTGFNYPFGEHVVYTDCQPLLTFVLRQFPFLHNYSIGILHFLMFFSFLVSPLIYLSLFRSFHFPKLSSFALSLSITILSPQYFRIYCGHYALAYACIIPFSIFLLLRYFEHQKVTTLIHLFFFNFLLFFIHPYYGLGVSVFSLLSLGFLLVFRKEKRWRNLLDLFIIGIVPVVLFRVFMLLSDTHIGRSPEPFGNTAFISEASSFLVPWYGPFSEILTKLIGAFPLHFEGYSYLGLGLNLLLVISLPFLLLFLRKVKPNKSLIALLVAAFFFLLFSLGLQYKLQEWFGIKIHALNQFRAMGRFSWFLYYVLPLGLFYYLKELMQQKLKPKTAVRLLNFVALFYLGFNLYEGDAYLKMYDGVMWEDRNVFNTEQLNEEEKYLIRSIQEKNAKVILPLPTYYIGSEIYERSYPNRPMFLSALYSYHCALPILSSCMSRTSVSETQAGINLINSYKKPSPGELALKNPLLFVIHTKDPLYEDEKRVWKVSEAFLKNDSTSYGFLQLKDLQSPILDSTLVEIKNQNHYPPDKHTIIYLGYEHRKPFQAANALSYEMVYETDTQQIKTGSYLVSFHYHTPDSTYIGTANSFIVAKKRGEEYHWQDFIPLKIPSGFGKGFSIIEHRVEIDGNYAYEFFIHGGDDFEYSVQNFLLRPATTSVRVITSNQDTLYNNFPR